MKNTIKSSKVIPIFPLPVTLFPSGRLPLHIFEERYRSMIDDITQTDSTFGIVRSEKSAGSFAATGCLAKLDSIERLVDGRMNILAIGLYRFTVMEVLEGRPYMRARVKFLEEPEPNDLSRFVAKELRVVLDDIIRLSSKLSGSTISVAAEVPDDPLELSYWIPSRLYGSPSEQQRILEMNSTLERLEAEHTLLDATRKHLAAKTALKDALG